MATVPSPTGPDPRDDAVDPAAIRRLERRSIRPRLRALFLATTLVVPLAASSAGGASAAIGATPSNDLFANAASVASLPTSFSAVDTSYATAAREVGEPVATPCASDVFATVWYRIRFLSTAGVRVIATPTNPAALDAPDAIVAIWTGSTLADLSLVACADEQTDEPERIGFAAEAETTYYIQVGVFDEEAPGPLDISFESLVPINDYFALATPIPTLPFTDLGVDTRLSSEVLETDEQVPGVCGGSQPISVWYRVAVVDRLPLRVTVTPQTIDGSDPEIDASISVWSGSSLSDLQLVDCADQTSYDGTEVMGFPAVTGQMYYIRIGSYAPGRFDVRLDEHPLPSDLFTFAAGATAASLPFAASGVNLVLANELTEFYEPFPTCTDNIKSTVWYRVTVNRATTIRAAAVPTAGATSLVDPVIDAWLGTTFDDFEGLACADSSGSGAVESMTFELYPGEEAYVRVGTYEVPGAVTVGIVDTLAPRASTPTASLPIGTTLTTTATQVKTRIAWSGTAFDGTSIAAYTVERSVDGGAFTSVSIPTPLTTAVVPTLLSGHSYVYRVRATDSAGRNSAWATSIAIRPLVFQESATAVRYGGTWTATTGTAYYGGRMRYARGAGAYAQLTFTGRQIAWVSSAAPSRGKAKIYLNGVLITTIDLYRSSLSPRRIVWSRSWATATSRTVKIVVVGTSGRPQIDLDGLVILR